MAQRQRQGRRGAMGWARVLGGLALCALAGTATAADSGRPTTLYDVMSGSATGTARETNPIAGMIFGMPVPVDNYYFAKRVAYLFPRPWEEGLDAAGRERAIWEALILHYESFRRGIIISDEELEKRVNSVLTKQSQTFTRAGDPAAYAAWVRATLNEDVALFENQMRYLYQIDKLKDQIRESRVVEVSEDEMRQEFLNEQHHVGGAMVTFDDHDAARAFYDQVRTPEAWERMQAAGTHAVRPVSLMTLEAYMDLWGIPFDQMYAFHALPLGAVGEPMPFGKQWCVYRLLEKRTGDLADFPAVRESYRQQLRLKKQYEALKMWVEELKRSAHLEVHPVAVPDAGAPAAPTEAR